MQESMAFCSLKDVSTPLGVYGIVLPPKARHALASRDFTLFLMQRISWVEDGLRVVIRQMLSDEGNVSDYLRLSYPENFAHKLRVTETSDPRRTLLFRLRYLFRCMGLVADHYLEFRHWAFTGIEMTLEVFVECVRQAVGTAVAERLKSSVSRFSSLWSTVDYALTDEGAVRKELDFLLNDLDEVFEILRDAFREKEAERAKEVSSQERSAEDLSALRSAQEESNRLHRAELRRCEALSAKRVPPNDPYARLAGLERVNAAQREELMACFRYSHEKFAVVKGDKSGSQSLQELADRVWRENAERFAALATLREHPGYKNARSLGAKLYKLAAKYPEADHFRWEPSPGKPN